MVQTLQAEIGVINHTSTGSLQIPVDNSLWYMIYIMDPKMNFLTYDSDMNKGIVIERKPNQTVSNVVPMKVDIFRLR